MGNRKEKARRLAEQEALKDKKHKLIQAVAQKCKAHHGFRNYCTKSLLKAINSYFEQYPSLVNATNLKNVDDLTDAFINHLQKCPTIISDNNEEKVSHIASNAAAIDTLAKETVKTSDSIKHVNTLDDISNPWELIDKYKILQAKEAARQTFYESEERKKKMAITLNEQIKEKQLSIENEKNEYRKYIKSQEQAVKNWEEEQKKLLSREKQNAEELKKVRENQIKERLRLKQMHDAIKKEEEFNEIKEIKKALMKEEEEKFKQKLNEREKWEQIMKENVKKLEEQKRRKEEEDRMDAKLMAEMKDKMDKDEAKRVQSIQNRSHKLDINSKLLSDKGAFKKREELRMFEQSLLKAAQERERAQMEEEQRRKENMANRIKLIHETNRKMIEDKRKLKNIIEKEKQIYVAECLKEAEALASEEKENISKQKENKLEYRELLRSQMEDHKQRGSELNCMTSAEWSINKKIIEDATIFLETHRDSSEQ